MSNILFETTKGEAYLAGAERAYAANLIAKLGQVILLNEFMDVSRKQAFQAILPEGHRLRLMPAESSYWEFSFRASFGMGDGHFVIEDQPVDWLAIQLNTAFAIGNAQLKLLARLHGQCELNPWIPASESMWMAGTIKDGLRSGVYRQGMGWECVLDLLDKAEEPIVISYSVTDGFPSPSHAGISAEEFEKLEYCDAWEASLKGLMQRKELKIEEEGFSSFRFDKGWDAFGVTAYLDRIQQEIEKKESRGDQQ